MKIELLNRKNQKIVGVLSGDTATCKGTCVMVHGFAGYKEQDHILAMQDVLLDYGFQTFNFDATNAFGESGGAFEQSTLGNHFEDFEDVANWVQEQEWFKGPLAVLGHSMGGYAVSRYAQDHSAKVAYCMPIAPAVSGKLANQAHRDANLAEVEEWERTGWLKVVNTYGRLRVRNQPWSHMQERLKHDLMPNAKNLTMPLYTYVGTQDMATPAAHVQIFYDAIPKGNKTIVVADGASHSYESELELVHLRASLDKWLKDTLPW